ncbi:hypothetical protein E0L36_05710 [Streptomyces sp. AJS327]|uniref:lytic transglycosylase domain-containing protein n=1 Tax=Streptomyces sp. AJS327 TaxID=2545265 RepID=UPI0015DF6512|nr:lytic murein transglycosylase [Streptomyces sp. AJS327]MBA0050409.1 hypothetical protein [Streptomyces sp. AJS327]
MARYRGKHAADKNASGTGQAPAVEPGGRGRLRRGLGGTAVAAVAMAALTASQAPGVELGAPHGDDEPGREGSAFRERPTPGDDAYHTDLPPLKSPKAPKQPGEPKDKGRAEAGVPASVLAAYKKAAASLNSASPGCGLRWELLAAIGKVESGQARGGALDRDGTTLRPILGPVLNGQGFAEITDTDNGRWDGDRTYDRAVGPLQFIPSTWDRWGADGNGDGARDPNNIHDAALAAGRYLCADGRDLSATADLNRAILSYNNSRAYLRTVLAWYAFYRDGVHEVPDGKGQLPTSPGAGHKNGTDAGGSGERGPGKRGGASGDGGKGDKGGEGEKPGAEKPGGERPGGGKGESPSPNPSPTPTPTPTPTPSPTDPTAVERVGPAKITATTGESFEERPTVRVTTTGGKAAADVGVRFAVRGETEARFPEKATEVTVRTGEDGTAKAPVLRAGGKAGTFTVLATVPGQEKLRAVEFTATVEAAPDPVADRLQRTSDTPLEAAAGETFEERVAARAEHRGEAAADVPVSARITGLGAAPYFKDEDGKHTRTLKGLTTNAKGVVTLPPLHADSGTGSYRLWLTAPGGALLSVKVTVTAG